MTPVLGEAPQAVAIPQPGRPAADLDVTAVRGRRPWRARGTGAAGRDWWSGGLLAAAAAVGVFAAVDTLGHHQAQTQAPSGSQHS